MYTDSPRKYASSMQLSVLASFTDRSFLPVTPSRKTTPSSASPVATRRLPSSDTATRCSDTEPSSTLGAGSSSFVHAPALHASTPWASCLIVSAAAGAGGRAGSAAAGRYAPVARSTVVHVDAPFSSDSFFRQNVAVLSSATNVESTCSASLGMQWARGAPSPLPRAAPRAAATAAAPATAEPAAEPPAGPSAFLLPHAASNAIETTETDETVQIRATRFP